ncbi:uncharacterized protein LY89DRAFT_783297 [Mollisia scopiformis]|uniref:Uncharacterized protein n=1 Tax=Mollisia scopiformis TaxID=149040 RepID=A0A194X8F7_MOLSC|nr:uncharacterized protein LY89DRAFT_783297 [Mollisia scopiformis]KUJ16077.1 hypothetical protein LY89DRAFT_783297 [Mollisia scopiformis]
MASSTPFKTITLLLLTLLLLTAEVSATAPFGMEQYEGYSEGVMMFQGSIYGHAMEMNGTIEEIFDRFTLEHPEVELDFKSNATAAGFQAERRDLQGSEAHNKVARSKFGLQCCPIAAWGWTGAIQVIIEDGIDYLNHVQARCGVGARSCVRVSCSWNAGIYLCNDNYYGIFPSCPYIGSYAQDISNVCWGFSRGMEVCCGQEFDTDSYNVIVRYANEGC